MKKVLAWHFMRDENGSPVLRDGRLCRSGKTYKHDGPLVMCESGLHASERLVDALQYAPGPWLARVECSVDIERYSDKLVCRHRRVLWMIDATTALHKAACDITEHALLRAGVDDARSWEAIKTKRRWLCGTATDEELAAASAAASAAAWGSARAAAWGSARFAASAAAWDAASAAAWDAAWAAAWDEWNAIFEQRIAELREWGE
jgi:hypothetical protein